MHFLFFLFDTFLLLHASNYEIKDDYNWRNFAGKVKSLFRKNAVFCIVLFVLQFIKFNAESRFV